MKALGRKFPFDPNSHQDAALAEFTAYFQPGTGSLSKFVSANFELQGSQYVQKKGKPNLSNLVNQAASIQRALYAGNPNQPQFQFTLKARAPDGESSEGVTIEGQELKASGTGMSTKTFIWSGVPSEATLTLSGKSYGRYPGSWGVFRFFQQYDWTRTTTGTGFHLDWTVRGQGGQTVQLNGKNEVVEFDFEPAAVPLFERGYLSGLKCPPSAKK